MPRAYTIATSALALGVSAKWLDNALSHTKVSGIRHVKQGVARQLSVEGLVVLGLAVSLSSELGVPLSKAVLLAEKIAHGRGRYLSHSGLSIQLDLDEFKRRLLEQLESAVEIAPVPRRGRPPQNETGRLD
ncbi:MAG: hypothetical protein ACJ79F_04540 [Gemmatimonadaceae bacterium]